MITKSSPKKKVKDKRLAGTEVCIYQTYKEVPVKIWSEITSGYSFFLKYDYLKAFENAPPANTTFRYVLTKSKGNYCCAAYIQIIDIEGDSIANFLQSVSFKGTGKYIQEKLKDHSGCIRMRLLVCGNAFISGEHGLAYNKKNISEDEVFSHLHRMIETVVKEEEKEAAVSMVLIKDYYPTSLTFLQKLKSKKYTSFRVDPNMILKLNPEWQNFDDYLKNLSSKYRIRAKSIIRAGAPVTMREFGAEDIVANKERIMQLYLELHNKAKFRPSAYNIETFAALKQSFGEQFIFTAYYLNNVIVAFKTYFVIGEGNFEAHFVGFDSAVNKQYELYQNILYHYVSEAIALRVSKIYYGRTALEIKSNIGAKPYELVCFIKHVNPVYNFMIKPFIKHLQPQGWIMRNPFKKVLERLS